MNIDEPDYHYRPIHVLKAVNSDKTPFTCKTKLFDYAAKIEGDLRQSSLMALLHKV